MIEIDLCYSPIPDGCLRRLVEVTIKKYGHVWRIHQNDSDPFPSRPHAHNLESGLKLDLRSGALFLGSQPTGKSVQRKHLIALRDLAEKRGVELPQLVS